jgi:uncharacterized protein YrrD
MLQSAQQLQGFTLAASDGEIGRVDDVYFDDQHWTLRYLVVKTGGWLSGRKVLISPISLKGLDWPNGRIDVALTRKQVEESPDIDTDKPVSRQREDELFRYYGYPPYWGGPYIWGLGAYPAPPVTAFPREVEVARELRARDEQASADSHLRSGNEVSGYDLEARDGAIGHVADLLFDDQSWSIRHIVVDTRNWLPGKHVLIASESIDEVSWSEQSVRVDATREAVKSKPEYDPSEKR